MAAPLACSNMAVARWITTRILAHLLLLATLATFDYPPVLSVSPTQSSHSESRAAARSCYPPDRDALVSFAQSLGFYNSALNASSLHGSRWTGSNCCIWSGITCGRSHVRHGNSSFARVTNLSWGILNYESYKSTTMSDYNYESPLSASISTSLCNLSALTILGIQLGTYLTNNSSVQHIQVPECVGSHLQLLEQFSCSSSLGSGDQRITIPASFSRLSKLRSFALDGLLLHSQSLDPVLNLPSLRSLAVTECTVRPLFTLSRLRLPVNLTSLDLHSCNLSGPLPAFNQTPFLESVFLDDNSLSSTLEEFVLGSHLPALSELSLGINSLSGSLPLAPLLQHSPNLFDLDLQSNGLTGTLPDQYSCPLCEGVSLNDNKFSGPFPAFINSGKLFHLDLSGNNFSGKPSEQWGHLMSLRWLSLSGNQIAADPATGRRLPHWLFRLPLMDLQLMSTGLQTTDCECHGALSLLNKTLRHLDVSGNNLTGPNILNCFALHNFTQSGIFLNLSGNPLSIALSSSYPPPNVQSLLLQSCRLYGPLTAKFLEQLPQVSPNSTTYFLDLSDNSLSGSIPLQLINQFDYIDLGHNVFTTYSGTGIYSNGYLTPYFSVSHNLLSADLTSLLSSLGLSHPCNIETDDLFYVTLDLSHNNVTGEIPIQFPCVLSRCFRILLNDNSLVGSIPNSSHKMLENAAEVFYGLQIRTLKLNNNELVGVVPPSLLNIIPLQLLDLSYNQLEGDLSMIFSSIKQPTHLRVLFLSYNQISGSIPLSFGALTPQLQIVQLSQNKLCGAIPPHLELPTFLQVDLTSSTLSSSTTLYEEVPIDAKGTTMEFTYELQALTSLDLSGNLLDGEIPSEFGKFVGLRYLNLSRNRLSGLILSTLSKLSILESMDLSFNQLRGPIPSDFSNLHSLAVFNVSFNPGLEGPIPEGPQISSNTSFEGDPWLCGYPILHPCRDGGPGKEVNQYTKKEEESSALGRFVEEWVDVRGLCLGIVLGFGAVIWARHAR